MKKFIYNILLIIFIVVLHYSNFLSNIMIYNTIFDLALIFIILYGFFDDEIFPFVFAFSIGLVLDFVLGDKPLGYNALIYTIIGFLSTFPKRVFRVDSFFIALIFITLFSFLKGVISLFINSIIGVSYNMSDFFMSEILFKSLYTLIVSIPFYLIYKNFYFFINKSRKHV